MYEVLGPRDGAQRSTAEKIVEKINQAVRTGSVRDQEWGLDNSRGYWFVVPGSLSQRDKEELRQSLKKAGWQVVNVRNSEENGERPGLATAIIRYPEENENAS